MQIHYNFLQGSLFVENLLDAILFWKILLGISRITGFKNVNQIWISFNSQKDTITCRNCQRNCLHFWDKNTLHLDRYCTRPMVRDICLDLWWCPEHLHDHNWPHGYIEVSLDINVSYIFLWYSNESTCMYTISLKIMFFSR